MIKKIFLNEKDMPRQWYNIVADMPNKPLPPLHPGTRMPVPAKDLSPLFPEEIIRQELTTEQYVHIPDEVRDLYKIWRPSPLHRATGLEKLLDAPVKIFYKYEGVSPSGSHKPNTAIPQAYYNYKEGVRRLTTGTGAGQWGTALSFACAQFGLACEVYMVRASYDQKPYRKILMNTFGAAVHPSPSLGIAISEAIEQAVQDEHTRYAPGSVLNHVLLHQTIIGLEADKQLEYAGAFPDMIIAPLGGGSNFAGIAFPFLYYNLNVNEKVRCIAVEPAPIHAGGLRYHGASALCSQLLKDGLIEAVALQQLECFEAGVLFAKAEGILPAPEAAHAIAQVIREARRAREEGVQKTILFNLCGHGLVDMQAYQDYFDARALKAVYHSQIEAPYTR